MEVGVLANTEKKTWASCSKQKRELPVDIFLKLVMSTKWEIQYGIIITNLENRFTIEFLSIPNASKGYNLYFNFFYVSK